MTRQQSRKQQSSLLLQPMRYEKQVSTIIVLKHFPTLHRKSAHKASTISSFVAELVANLVVLMLSVVLLDRCGGWAWPFFSRPLHLGGKKLPAETEIHHWFCAHCAYINIRLQVMCLTLPSAPQSTPTPTSTSFSSWLWDCRLQSVGLWPFRESPTPKIEKGT